LSDKILPIHPNGFDEPYHVELPEFYGPMDLLLSLIEREELEITEIALARVTDQFLAYVASMKELTPDDLTDFLVLASKLILIKSQVLLPRPPASIIDDDDEAETDDLVQQLKDYKRFKQLAGELGSIETAGQRNYIRIAAPPKIEPKLIPGDVSLADLLTAVRRALAVKPAQPDVDTVVKRQIVTIGQQIKFEDGCK
jgi:segregation and condensation protein A